MRDLLDVADVVAAHYHLNLQPNPHFTEGDEQLRGFSGLYSLLLTTLGYNQTLQFIHNFDGNSRRESISIGSRAGEYTLAYKTGDLAVSIEKFRSFVDNGSGDLRTRFARELRDVLPTITRPACEYRLSFSFGREELPDVPSLIFTYLSAA